MPRAFIIELPCLEHSAIGHAAHLVEMLRSANLVASLRLGRRAPRFGWRWVDGQGDGAQACAREGGRLCLGAGVEHLRGPGKWHKQPC